VVKAAASKPAAKAKPEAAPKAQPEATAKAKPAAKAACTAPPASASKPTLTEHVFLTDTALVELKGCQLVEAAKAAEPPKDAAEGTIKLSVVLSRTSSTHRAVGSQQILAP